MAISNTKKASPAKASSSNSSNVALENKVASLEALVASLSKELAAHCAKSEKEHAALEAKCDACCSASSASSSGVDANLESKVAQMWKLHRRNR